MSTDSEQTCDQARFAAREFVARWSCETGEPLSAVVTDRMLFAYEMGYLRGRSTATQDSMKMFAATQDSMKMFDEISQTRQEPRKETDDDTTE